MELAGDLHSGLPDRHIGLSFFVAAQLQMEAEACRICPQTDEEGPLWEKFITIDPEHPLQILYLFGIGSGKLLGSVFSWLEQAPERAVVLLEPSASILQQLLLLPRFRACLKNQQIYVKLLSSHPRAWGLALAPIICHLIASHIEVRIHPAYKRIYGAAFNRLRWRILKASSYSDAVMRDLLHRPKLAENLFLNIPRWPASFSVDAMKNSFQGIPIIICGAGPSLNKQIEWIKTMENRALIMAGGSAITALSKAGVRPHLCLAIDPNIEEFERFHAADLLEFPLLYGSRLNPAVFSTFCGSAGLLWGTGGSCERHLQKALGLAESQMANDFQEGAASVTTLGMTVAHWLGGDPICFAGVDLAFVEGQRYASGVSLGPSVTPESFKGGEDIGDHLVRKRDKQGKLIYTLLRWVLEAEVISRYAKKKRDRRWVNLSPVGLPIPNLENLSMAEQDALFPLKYDLRGLVHAKIQQASLVDINAGQIGQIMLGLHKSILSSQVITEDIVKELHAIIKNEEYDRPFPPAMLLLGAQDFESQRIYEVFFSDVELGIDRFLYRLFPGDSPQISVKRTLTKWRRIGKMLQAYKELVEALINTLAADKAGLPL